MRFLLKSYRFQIWHAFLAGSSPLLWTPSSVRHWQALLCDLSGLSSWTRSKRNSLNRLSAAPLRAEMWDIHRKMTGGKGLWSVLTALGSFISSTCYRRKYHQWERRPSPLLINPWLLEGRLRSLSALLTSLVWQMTSWSRSSLVVHTVCTGWGMFIFTISIVFNELFFYTQSF